METLKINYLTYGTGRTGGTRVLMNFANELDKMGHEVSFTTLAYNNWFHLPQDVKIISKRTKFDFARFLLHEKAYNVGLVSESSYLSATIKILNALYDISEKSDVDIATVAPTAYVASWGINSGSTPFYHMQHFETINYQSNLLKKFVLDTYYLPIYKVANSSWLSSKLKDLTGKDFPIINPAIEHDIFYPRNEQYERNENEINIVCLGKGGWKNALGVYEAVCKVRKKVKEKRVILHLFGPKPTPNIPFDGIETIFHLNLSDEELAKLYSRSDIQITFSQAESFPLPSLEAMACGCTVITTPFGVEDYAKDYENALLIEVNNVNMLVSKLLELIEDEKLREKLRKEGLNTASKFQYEIQAKLLMDNIKIAQNEYSSFKKYKFL